MKSLFIMLMATTLSLGASAQHRGGYYHSYRPRVVIVPSISYGYGYGYPYYGYPYYGYPYNYGMPYYQTRRMPYQLSLQIQSIKVDYKNQIKAARHDKTMKHSQKRAQIRYLKAQRDQAIVNAERNYRPPANRNNQNSGRNNQNPTYNGN